MEQTLNPSAPVKKKKRKKRGGGGLAFNGAMLKGIGGAFMVLYTASSALFRNGVLHAADFATQEEWSAYLSGDPARVLYEAIASMIELLGCIAVPIFAFLLVQGFLNTADWKGYLKRVVLFAVISEIPYDLAMSGVPVDLGGQNALFTLAIGLGMLKGLETFEGQDGVIYQVDKVLVVALSLFFSYVLGCAFGLCTILLIAAYYLLREKKLASVLTGAAVSLMYIVAPVAGLLLWGYNGERGKVKNKYTYYVLYPAHLLVLWALGVAWGMM